ncbi:PEP/pyruvate-binding domain-containing protein [Natrarchaeobius oligotrophus]|uniref:Phosphoenolpyruvate synthase n=1 Tax=Natrarchaeobius chitinivorans TaxID=1679083 RepID=A0A3N6LZS6_NATCH|nr:PEP/pyruvate-binding domain-containing protein [Natrarchaeobius chitinivorans]RQG94747.1 phosphoenolpyruvate synthase [Natrarchaeobius chitinivorans]
MAILERAPAVLSLSDPRATNTELSGGKGANLAKLVSAGLPVPDGSCVTTAVYEELADDEEISAMIDDLEATDPIDTERLRERATELRDTIKTKELPEDVRESIEVQLEPGISYVTRSSATAEDLPTASFAGQHSTVLDVSSLADVTDAVLDCMASLFTDRAVSYRARNEIAHEEVSMCVVVQEMIDADASGVLFTADPLTGKRTVSSIDASTGLGEAVVSGTVTAEKVRVDRESGDILEYRAGVSGDDGSNPVGANEPVSDIENGGVPDAEDDRVLTDEQVTTLVAYGEGIERSFGSPQDIEWSIADGQFWMLQTRPITTLSPLPEPRPDDDALHVYYSWNHRQGMTEVMPPFVVDYWSRTMDGLFDRFGSDPETGLSSATAGGMVYIDVTSLLQSDRLAPILLEGLNDFDRQAIAPLEAVREQRGDELAQSSMLRGTSLTQTASTIGKLAPVVGETFGSILQGLVSSSYERVPRRARQWADASAAEMIRDIRAGNSEAERLRIALETNDEFSWEAMERALKLWNVYFYRAALRRLCPNADDEFEALERGLRENVTTAMMIELGDVTDVARDNPQVKRALEEGRSLDEIREVAGGEEFTAAFENFLDENGFRAPAEIEFSRPRYHEDPAPLLSTVRAKLETGEPGDHRTHVERLETEAKRAISRLERQASRERFGSVRRRLVRPFALRYRSYLSMREVTKYALSQLLDETRRQVLAAGEKLERDGRLEDANDVWLYDFDELLAELTNPNTPTDVDLDARRAEQFHHQQLRAPRVITSDGEIPRGSIASDVDTDGLVGIPTASGVAEGHARVIEEPSDATLETGEILVAPHTDPGWTPLFLNAAGLVTNNGGKMTHGSIVAREYGIPSVVVAGATEQIETGQRIRVDGNRGVVELLDD